MENPMNNSRLCIQGFPNHKLKDDVWRELGRVGMRDIVEVVMYKYHYGQAGTTGISRYTSRSFRRPFRGANSGHALVDFISPQHAADALQKFSANLTLWDTDVNISWQLRPDVDRNGVRVLHVQNLDRKQSPDELRRIVNKIVGPDSVESVRKVRNYAFVHMATRELAEEALLGLKEYYNYSLIEVQWARSQNGNFPQSNTYKPNSIERRSGSTESRCSSLFSLKSISPSMSPEPPETPETSTTRSISDESFGSSCEELEILFEANKTRRAVMENASLRQIMFGNKKTSAPNRDNRTEKLVKSEATSAETPTETSPQEAIVYPRLFDEMEMGQFSFALPTKEYAENYDHARRLMTVARRNSLENRQPWRPPSPAPITSSEEERRAGGREEKANFYLLGGEKYDPIQYFQKRMDLLYGD